MKWNKNVTDTTKKIVDAYLLKGFVDDGTTTVTIHTPKGWKCEKKNCTTLFFHTHSTFKAL